MKLLKGNSTFKNRLTKLNDQEPLTKLALTVIILLDIFILSVVFGGLSTHTAQLTSPDEYFPHECRRIFIEKEWSNANKIDNLQRLVLSDYNNYSYRYNSPFEKSKIDKMQPDCKKLYEAIKAIVATDDVKQLFVARQEIIDKKNQWIQQYNKNKNIYETKLLENIAEQNKTPLETISGAVNAQSKEIERLNAEMLQINKQVSENQLVNNLWQIIRPGDTAFRQTMIKALNRYERIYLFIELIWQLVFMLPLFVIFYIWHTRSIKKNRTMHILISSHLLIIALIPIIIKVIQVVLELIPYHFFKELFKLLELLHIIALWHYIVIFVSIGVAMVFVYMLQKKFFSQQRLRQTRLMKGECYFCGKKLPAKTSICPFCGTNQLKKCANCNADTFFGGEYCIHCGKVTDKSTKS